MARQTLARSMNTIFAGELCQIRFQGGLAAHQHDIEDGVPAHVAEGGGVAVFPGEEMLVNTEDARTS